MSYPKIHSVTLTTDAAGDVTGFLGPINGKIINVIYVKDDFDNGVDFTITLEKSLQNVWTETNVNVAKTVAPRQPTHDPAGLASLYAAAGEPVEDYIYAVGVLGGDDQERLKIVVAQGGNVKSGTFKVIVA